MRYGSLLLLGPALVLSSCAELRIHSRGHIPVWIGPKPGHNHYIEIEGKRQFFLWGLVPDVHEVNIDDELHEAGLLSAANVSVTIEQSWGSFFKEILSLGIYVPREYKIRAFGVVPKDTD